MDDDSQRPAAERSETEAERQDRKWDDMLQELRVMQTSAQLTAGFLLTLPFQQAFADLSTFERNWFLALVVLAAVVVGVVLAPVAIHRRLSGLHVKDKVVASGHVFIRAALALLALLVAGVASFIFHVVVGQTPAAFAGAILAVLLVAMLFVVPRALVRR